MQPVILSATISTNQRETVMKIELTKIDRGENHDEQVVLRLSKSMKQNLIDKAKIKGVSLSRFIRARLCGGSGK